MSDIARPETHAKIIAEARDKYTVHECNQCAWRKCCSEGFGSEKCGKFRESIFLKLGIEDGYFIQLLDRLEAAHKRELSKNVSKNWADFGQLGDAAKLREALKDIGRIVEQIRLLYSDFPSEIHAIARKANAALAAPPRNCDKYSTFNDAIRSLADKRGWHDARWNSERYCILAQWLFATATEKEGGAK